MLTTLGKVRVLFGSPNVTLNKPLFAWDEYDIFQLVMNKAPVFDIGILEPSEPEIYPNPIKIALQYQQMVDEGIASSRADLAHILDVSRKVTQMLNLLKLDEEIQEFMLGLEDRDERLKVLTEVCGEGAPRLPGVWYPSLRLSARTLPGLWGKPYRRLLVQEAGLLSELHGTADGGYRRPVDG